MQNIMMHRELLIEKHIKPSEIEKVEYGGNSVVVERWFDKHGELYSFNGQPSEIHYENDKIMEKWWCRNGFAHRDKDKPACVFYNLNGKIKTKAWYKNGISHRDGNNPSAIHYNEKNKFIKKHWYKNGEFIKEKLF